MVQQYTYYSNLGARLVWCADSLSKRITFKMDFLIIFHVTIRSRTDWNKKQQFLMHLIRNITTVWNLVLMIQYQFWKKFIVYIWWNWVRESPTLIFIKLWSNTITQEEFLSNYNGCINVNGARINKQNNKVMKRKNWWKAFIFLLKYFCSDALYLDIVLMTWFMKNRCL